MYIYTNSKMIIMICSSILSIKKNLSSIIFEYEDFNTKSNYIFKKNLMIISLVNLHKL